jgi:hypothetical protein
MRREVARRMVHFKNWEMDARSLRPAWQLRQCRYRQELLKISDHGSYGDSQPSPVGR